MDHRTGSRAALAAILVAGGLWWAGCGSDSGTDSGGGVGPPVGEIPPEFALRDVNPNTATHDSLLSPGDHLGNISAWWFGKGTT
ncbi:MAG: hypothetical protein GF355_04865 [Candidatus Eisenbacteria bacterium]|nr:hypothetical protein [Candidatus Eisenbacteria bacterium]